MIKRVAGFGTIAFWVTVTCVRLITSIPDEIPEMILLKDYAIVEPMEKATVEPDIIEEPLTTIGKSEYTEEEIQLMVRLAMSEAGKLDVDAIQGVVQTAMNRVKSDDYPNTITEVIYQRINGCPQFLTADNGEPNAKCYEAVRNAIECPDAYPVDMYWFNSIHTPNYGHYYTEVDGMYFSTETDYYTGVEE